MSFAAKRIGRVVAVFGTIGALNTSTRSVHAESARIHTSRICRVGRSGRLSRRRTYAHRFHTTRRDAFFTSIGFCRL
jgi:hypothetical protein